MKRKTLYVGILLFALLASVGLASATEFTDLAVQMFGQLSGTADGVRLSAGYQQSAFPGESISFKHTVWHTGDVSVAVNLSVAADNPDWVVSFEPASVELGESETATVELVVRPPTSITEGITSQVTITATGSNTDEVIAVNTVQILSHSGKVHLPLVMQESAAPQIRLQDIENFNGDGEYIIRWSSRLGATNYILQEATNSDFTDANTVYSGPDLSTVIQGKPPGFYYYRVQSTGSVAWSPSESTIVIPEPGIFGIVTHNQTPISGISLELRCYDDSSQYTADTTTTGSEGIYVFDSAPGLDGSQYCNVRYGPNNSNSNYLFLWENYFISYYVLGTTMAGGDLEIANVVLGEPDSSDIQSFPLTFHWTPRRASPDDSYELRILDASNSEEVWSSGPLGYVGSYTMNERPAELSTGVLYGWYILVDGDNGLGISHEVHRVVFNGDAQACLYIDNDTGSNMTFRIHGMASKTMPTGRNLYDCFPPGTYTYTASASCGSLTDTDDFSVGSSTLIFYCGVNFLDTLVPDVDLDSPVSSIPRLPASDLHRRLWTNGNP